MAKKVGKYVGRVLLVILVTLVILVGTLYLMLYKICNGPSQAAKEMFVTTILETGQLKFLASWVCTDEEIKEIVDKNTMSSMNTEIDDDLIHIVENPEDEPVTEAPDDPYADEVFDENGVRIEEINGRTFFAKMMIIKDPAQVRVNSVANGTSWPEYGIPLDELVGNAGAIGGVNGGLYESTANKGGHALGVVVQNGKEILVSNSMEGLFLIGFNAKNFLCIKDLKNMSNDQVRAYIKDEGIRDAVVFQEENTDKNNHFVPLVINGEGRELAGQGSGANPRTAIGQRSDGAVLLLVTDGRGADGHLGATAADLIGIMLEYGAVNAANIDGGSSSSMYYKDNYEMTSVTFYYQNSSWRLPTSFVVMPKSN